MNAGSAADDFGCPRDKTCQEGRRTDPRTLVWLVHPLQRGGPCFSSSWHQSMFRPSCMHDEGHHPVDRLTRDPITSELPTIGSGATSLHLSCGVYLLSCKLGIDVEVMLTRMFLNGDLSRRQKRHWIVEWTRGLVS